MKSKSPMFNHIVNSGAAIMFVYGVLCIMVAIWFPFVVIGLVPDGFAIQWYGVPLIITLLLLFIAGLAAGVVCIFSGIDQLDEFES